VSLRRPVAPSSLEGWTVEGHAFLTLAPYRSMGATGRAFLILDVIFRPAADDAATAVLRVHELAELVGTLLSALVDEVGPAMFTRFNQRPDWELLAAAVLVSSTAGMLGDFVDLHEDGWGRAEGALDRQGAEWLPESYSEIETPEQRAATVRDWIKKLLRDSGIRGHELDIDAMPVPSRKCSQSRAPRT